MSFKDLPVDGATPGKLAPHVKAEPLPAVAPATAQPAVKPAENAPPSKA
jgi:hypothetical protein